MIMMKNFKYIVALAAMAVGLPVLAQEPGLEPEKVYTHVDTVVMGCTPSSAMFTDWRKPVKRVTGFYHDTVEASIVEDPYTIYYDIHTLHLYVKEYVTKDTTKVSACEYESPYYWLGKPYSKSGKYTDTIKVDDITKKDTICFLNLSFIKSFEEHAKFSICPGDSVWYRGKYYSKETLDTVYLTNPGGCDSTIYIYVSLKASSLTMQTVHIGERGSYTWKKSTGEVVLTKDGWYDDSLKNVEGCDSIVRLHLVVDHVRYRDTSFCEGDTLYYKKHKIFTECVIYDTLLTLYGGDSIICITCHMKDRPMKKETFYYCKNDFPLPWPKHEKISFSGPGIYRDYHPSRVDTICDSLFIADVKEFAPVIIDSVVSLRADKDSLPYVWTDKYGVRHNFFHSKDTVDTLGHTRVDTIPDFQGCDSILMLRIQIVEHFGDTTLQLCPGGVVKVGLQKYTAVGECEQLLQRSDSSTFSDSILFVHIIPADIHHNDVWDTVTICQNETPYAWHHRKCMTSGEYKDTLTAKTYPYCDSIVHLRLTVLPLYLETHTFYVCDGHTAEWGGKQFEIGRHVDTVPALTGCDSVFIVNVIQDKSYYWCDTVYIKEGESYTWRNHYGKDTVLTQEDIYYDKCHTVHGCDSVYRLDLIYKKNYLITDSVVICKSETPYIWRHNIRYYTSGVYWDSLHTARIGGDSVYQLKLTVLPTYTIDSTVYACGGTSITIGENHKKTFTQSGSFQDSLVTTRGCDSVIVYHVNFIQTIISKDTAHLGNNPSYEWRGQILTEPRLYTDKIPSKRLPDCDSLIFQLLLIKDSTYAFETTATICSNETYRWHGIDYQTAGDYTWKGVSQYGMDSIETLHLKVNPAKDTIVNINKCRGQSLTINGKTITQSGVYIDTYRTLLGCDSTVTSVVNFYPTYSQCDTLRLIKGTSVTWHGRIYTEPGIDSIHLTTSTCGCDSNLYVRILLADSYSFTENETICQGDTLYWHGKKLFEAGTYTDPHVSRYGADSTYYINLSVAPTYADTSYATLCAGGKLKFFQQTITKPGTYTESLISTQGCDSIFVLYVNPSEATITYNTLQLCQGQTFRYRDTVFTTSGEYEYKDKSIVTGCDSIVHLTVKVAQNYLIDTTATINQGGSFLWKGHLTTPLTKEGIYWDRLTTVNGCDSIYRLTLKVNLSYYFENELSICKSETPYYWHDKWLTESGTYYDSLYTKSVGLDSIYCLKLEVRDATLHDETIYACQGEIIEMADHTKFTKSGIYLDTLYGEGCPQVTRYNINFYRAFHDTTYDVICENSTYIWRGHFNDTILTKDGDYIDYHRTINDCDSVYVLHLTKLPKYLHDTTIYVCSEEIPYVHNGLKYSVNMDFVDSSHNVAGCDSINITRYRLNDKCSNFELFMRCSNQSLYIDGREITADGEYRIPLPGDSIHRFRVVSWPQYEFDTFLGDSCDKATYKGKTYYARSDNDTVRDTRYWKTVHDCDSIEHVTLVLHRTADPKTNTQDIFDYAYMLFDGERYEQTGVYTHNRHTMYGCDSIVTLDLRVTPTDHPGSLLFYYCSGVKEDLVVFNKSYHPTQDTIIIDTIRYEGFGMMKIQMATVYVTSPFTITSLEAPEEICAANPTAFNIHYKHKGFFPTHYELTFLPNQLVATPNPQKGEINYKDYVEIEMSNRGTCVSPGEYPYKLLFTSDLCTISDTVVYGTIVVRYPTSIMESYWDNTIALVNPTYNEGSWKFLPPYNWQIFSANGEEKTLRVNPNQSQSYISSSLLIPGDRITVTPLREGYDKAVPSCEYTFTYTLKDGQEPVLVYPTAVRKSTPVTIESTTSGAYSIYNDTGNKLTDGTFNNSKQNVTMPSVEGCYLLYINPQNAGTQIHKIIVY